jgi:hypothetical protein
MTKRMLRRRDVYDICSKRRLELVISAAALR